MHGAQRGAVARGGADLAQTGEKGVLIHFAQYGLAEDGGDGLHLARDGGVLVGQVGVVGAAVDDAQGVAKGREIELQMLDDGLRGVGKVDRDDAADGGGHLIHQAAGLAEILVFDLLPEPGDLDGVQARAAEPTGDRPQQHLKGGRGGETAARQHRGADIGVKARLEPGKGGDAADQGGGGPEFPGADGQIVQRDLAEGITLGEDTDHALAVLGDGGHGLQIDGPGQDPAELMVGVVAADLGAARRGEEVLRAAVIGVQKLLLQFIIHKAPSCSGSLLKITQFASAVNGGSRIRALSFLCPARRGKAGAVCELSFCDPRGGDCPCKSTPDTLYLSCISARC